MGSIIMNTKKTIILTFLVPVLLSAQFADTPEIVTKVATATANWLKLETDVRSIGMGGTNVAVGKGVSVIPQNPAALAFLEKSEVYYSKVNYLAGINHQVLAIGSKVGHSDFIGLHLFYLDSGPMERTTLEQSQGTGTFFHVNSLSMRTVYARRLTDRLKVGITLNYLLDRIDDAHMQSFAFDIGSNFNTGIYGFTLGMAVSNFGPEVTYYGDALIVPVNEETDPTGEENKVTESFPIPMSFRLGITNELVGPNSTFYPNANHRFSIAIDGINPLDYLVTGNLGFEYAWNERVFARIGNHLGHDTAGFSTGFGLRYRADRLIIGIDYAYVNYGTLENSNQFGITMDF